MRMRLAMSLACCALSISTLASSQNDGGQLAAGKIEGKISFSDGEVAANIQLFVTTRNNYQVTTRADDQGHYIVDSVPIGDVFLYPYDLSKLYPLRADMFLLKNPDRIELTKEHPTATKDIIVPPKAGIIEGTVVSDGGVPIGGVQIVLCHSEEVWRSAEIHSEDNGHFRYIVPSGEPISVYTRRGDDKPSQQANIILQPGGTRSMKFVTATNAEESDVRFEGEACKPFRPAAKIGPE
jgi:hypothetical protein